MKEQEISVQNPSGEKLVGSKTIPERNSGRTALLVHGFATNQRGRGMFDDLAQKLVSQGVTAYELTIDRCTKTRARK